LLAALADIADGAQSLGELDLATLCRRRGLPEPDRQQVQHTSRGGRIYLDARWTKYNVVVEVNGAGHLAVATQLDDDYRDTELRLMGQLLLRVSTLQLRTDPEPFLDQLTAALRKRGWRA
jgi:very-short-patch-repair endonuclease